MVVLVLVVMVGSIRDTQTVKPRLSASTCNEKERKNGCMAKSLSNFVVMVVASHVELRPLHFHNRVLLSVVVVVVVVSEQYCQ